MAEVQVYLRFLNVSNLFKEDVQETGGLLKYANRLFFD